MQIAIGAVIGSIMALLANTIRWRPIARAEGEAVWGVGKPVILVVWHGRLLMAHKGWPLGKGEKVPIKALVSNSKDGEIITRAFARVGVDAIRGSAAKGGQQKGGMEAMIAMIRALRAGQSVCITPDGPRGPRMRVQRGVISLARATGAPILCMSWNTAGRTVLKSWDRMVMPSPFSQGVVVWSKAMHVARDASPAEEEQARLALEGELNRITALADTHFGAAIIEPDPAPQAPP